MSIRTHELHPALVHAPLTLLPMAALTDLAAVITRSRRLDRLGRSFWLLGCGSGLMAGLAGMAASQEVDPHGAAVDDLLYMHGAGNVAILTASSGVALWRMGHRATLRSATIGLSTCAMSVLTAYLGGELVYGHGVGVGETQSSPLFSAAGRRALVRDAAAGFGWLVRRTVALVSGEQPLAPAPIAPAKAKRTPRPARPGNRDTH